MKQNILILGHTGRLGAALCHMLAPAYNIIGLARRSSQVTGVYNIKCDLLNPNAAITEAFTRPITHVIHLANSCRWVSLGKVDSMMVLDAYKVGVSSLLQIGKHALEQWKDPSEPKSITVVSSIAGLKVYGDLQAIYGPMKAAQAMTARHLGAILPDHVRVNTLMPNSFPRILSTERVVSRVVHYIESSEDGCEEVLDR